jgi:hypothetical protein
VAPRPVVLGALVVGAAAALLVPGGPPGVGLVLVALVSAAVVGTVRRRAPAAGAWQVVHGVTALVLVAAVAVRDAPWLVALDLLAALLLLALALAPAGSWTAVLAALPRLGLRAPVASSSLARGVVALGGRGGPLGPALRGLVLTGALLVVFLPLLASADERFAELVAVPAVGDLHLAGRGAALVLGAVAAAAALSTRLAPPPPLVLPPAPRLLRRTSEWLMPLGALGALLAAFLLVQVAQPRGASVALELRAGFFQLVAVTALVLAVVAAAVRWTPATRGVRAALGVLCVLTLLVDLSALARLQAYVGAYGWTRLRIGVAMVALGLAAVLLVVLVAGCRRGPQRWVPHAVVLVGALVMAVTTAADPDAVIARSGVAQGVEADTWYLSTLSADAVPALLELHHPDRACVLAAMGARLPEAPWTSGNLSRARAARLLGGGPIPWWPTRPGTAQAPASVMARASSTVSSSTAPVSRSASCSTDRAEAMGTALRAQPGQGHRRHGDAAGLRHRRHGVEHGPSSRTSGPPSRRRGATADSGPGRAAARTRPPAPPGGAPPGRPPRR